MRGYSTILEMKKLFVLIAVLLISIFFAGLFGIIHDQVTYTICPEYFTRFKFFQFGLANTDNDGILPNPRLYVSVVGFLATWWVGFIIGLVLGVTGLIFKSYKKMFAGIMKALGIIFCITIFASFAGFLVGTFYLVKTGVDWWLPEGLIDKDHFIIVGSIHNFSYLGGISGLLISMISLIKKARRTKMVQEEPIVEKYKKY